MTGDHQVTPADEYLLRALDGLEWLSCDGRLNPAALQILAQARLTHSPASGDAVREALVQSTAKMQATLAAMDKYNEKNDTHIIGPSLLALGKQIAANEDALTPTTLASAERCSTCGSTERHPDPCYCSNGFHAPDIASADDGLCPPREPTQAMLMAGRKQTFADMFGAHCGPSAENTWKAMYDAAKPKPEQEAGSACDQ